MGAGATAGCTDCCIGSGCGCGCAGREAGATGTWFCGNGIGDTGTFDALPIGGAGGGATGAAGAGVGETGGTAAGRGFSGAGAAGADGAPNERSALDETSWKAPY